MAWWPFGASRGTSGLIRDLANGRYPMTQFNTPTWVIDGEFGPCLLFDDGATEYLQLGSAPITAAPLTMTSWFNSDDDTIQQALMWIGDVDSTVNWFSLEIMGSVGGNPVRARARAGAITGDADTTSGYSANTWHHAAAVFISSTSRASFIDGGSKGTDVTDATPANSNDTAIGRLADSTPGRYFSGRTFDTRLYGGTKTNTEILQMANPNSMWELYQVPRHVWAMRWVAAVGVNVPVLEYHYRHH